VKVDCAILRIETAEGVADDYGSVTIAGQIRRRQNKFGQITLRVEQIMKIKMMIDEATLALRCIPAAARKAQNLYAVSMHPGAMPRLISGWSLVPELPCGVNRVCRGGASARRAHPNRKFDSIQASDE
jgi:hypothetical protein